MPCSLGTNNQPTWLPAPAWAPDLNSLSLQARRCCNAANWKQVGLLVNST